MKTHRLILAVLAILPLSLPSRAEIILTLDTTTRTLWFSGSDTGTLSSLYWWDFTGWAEGKLSNPYGTLDITDAFSFSSGTTYGASLMISSSAIEIDTIASGAGSTDTVTISAAGSTVSFDYSGLSSAYIAYLESLIGSTIDPPSDSDFSALRVIPEPATYALIAGCATLSWVLIRRRRHS